MRYYVSLIKRARCARREVELSTQEIRSKLIIQLTDMFELAHNYSQAEKATPKQKQMFMRVMAYIAQVINSLSKSFDEATVTKDLEVLENMINEAVAKGKDKGTKAEASGSSGS